MKCCYHLQFRHPNANVTLPLSLLPLSTIFVSALKIFKQLSDLYLWHFRIVILHCSFVRMATYFSNGNVPLSAFISDSIRMDFFLSSFFAKQQKSWKDLWIKFKQHKWSTTNCIFPVAECHTTVQNNLFVFHNNFFFVGVVSLDWTCNAHALDTTKWKVFRLLNCVHRILLQNCYLALGFCTPFRLEIQLYVRWKSFLSLLLLLHFAHSPLFKLKGLFCSSCCFIMFVFLFVFTDTHCSV